MDSANSLVVDFDRRSLIAMSGFGLLLGVLGVLLLVYATELGGAVEEPPWFVGAIGLVLVIFFGGWGLVAARHVLYLGPALVIDAEGIVDGGSLARLGPIPWSDIAGFGSGSLAGSRLLVIKMQDSARVLRDTWPWAHLVHCACRRRYGGRWWCP